MFENGLNMTGRIVFRGVTRFLHCALETNHPNRESREIVLEYEGDGKRAQNDGYQDLRSCQHLSSSLNRQNTTAAAHDLHGNDAIKVVLRDTVTKYKIRNRLFSAGVFYNIICFYKQTV
ncbi:hypothetical protein PENTCL1PPCAC_28205, partial [Pristionchus entomophagus]